MRPATKSATPTKSEIKNLRMLHSSYCLDGRNAPIAVMGPLLKHLLGDGNYLTTLPEARALIALARDTIKGTEYEEMLFPKPLTPAEREWEREFDKHLESGATLEEWLDKKLKQKT